jgi:hypothetical protein
MTPEQLEEGYRAAYREFYSWSNIVRGAATKDGWLRRGRHVAYAAGWKKFERLWDVVIQARRLRGALPVLEGVLSGLGRVRPANGVPAEAALDAVSPERPVRLTVQGSGRRAPAAREDVPVT